MNEKKHNIFYKTTNVVNGKYYYGIHSTNDLDDGYLGSGKTMLKAIKKYGRKNFIREVVGLPVFKHKIYYSSGEHSEHEHTTRWEGADFKNQEVLGYLLKDSRGQVFRLHILADLRLKTK